MYVVHTPYTLGMAICELVQESYRGSDRGPLLTKAKKEEDARDNRNHGYRHGIALAIAELLTVERSKKFYLWPVVEKVDYWDVTRVLGEHHDKFTGAFPDGDEASSITDFVFALIDGDEGQLAVRHEEDRRKKVLSGDIPATEKDRGWLQERVDAANKIAQEMQSIMQRSTSKVNDAPVTRGSI